MAAKKHSKLFNVGMVGLMVVILAVLIVANVLLLTVYDVSIDNLFMSAQTSDDDEISTTLSDWEGLALDIEEEGIVLLRNEDETLPLSADSMTINLLGAAAYTPVYGGSGSGATDTASALTLLQALEDEGFDVNSAPLDEGVYEENVSNQGGGGFSSADFSYDTTAISTFTGTASFANMQSYSDIAVIVIGRSGGEGNDLLESDVGTNVLSEGHHYLELSDEEEALISQASTTFGTVIVLYNGANPLELGFLETYNVDAALWVGQPGSYGFEAVADVLTGTVNPSGRLPDTYAYDATSAPSYQNYGDNSYSNYTSSSGGGFGGFGGNRGTNYVDYAEGIYVGYKWYETAATEGYLNYDQQVQYPFGYGLSYTTFTQEIVGGTRDNSTFDGDDEITITVEVTNTGSVAGKDVVEVYFTPPYTDYDQENGVEKSSVNLVAYAKTDLLAAGASQEIEITFKAEDMASYNSSHSNSDGTTGCYMLSAGDYVISLRSDSHTVISTDGEDQEITVEMGSNYFYEGNNKRSDDDQAASNQFDDALRSTTTYLSRAGGFANYTTAMTSVSDVADDQTIYNLDNLAEYDEALDTAVTKTYTAGVDYRTGDYVASEDDLVLDDMQGLDYDDERWDQLISQMSLSEMTSLIATGGWQTIAVESIGKDATIDIDGPSGWNNMFGSTDSGISYPASIVLAATWNVELAEMYGNYMADEGHSLGVTGWYAPAMNIHRSPFSGRNFEYYSEDAVLSAGAGAYVTKGARDGGLIVYIKHFALNDQETNRSGVNTWSTEQAIREIYLKPFEESVKLGGATGVMSSYNYVGSTWSGAHVGLLTEVLRNEWGFRGMVITDAGAGTSQVDAGIRAGNDLWLSMSSGSVASTETDADIYYVMRAVKNILYAEANATVIPATSFDWEIILYVFDALLVVAFIACAVALGKNIFAKKQ